MQMRACVHLPWLVHVAVYVLTREVMEHSCSEGGQQPLLWLPCGHPSSFLCLPSVWHLTGDKLLSWVRLQAGKAIWKPLFPSPLIYRGYG
jgi:hypothetical protein